MPISWKTRGKASEIVEAFLAGKTIDELSKEYDIQRHQIRRKLNTANVAWRAVERSRERRLLTDTPTPYTFAAAVIETYLGGRSIRETARFHRVNDHRVTEVLEKYSVPFKPRGETRRVDMSGQTMGAWTVVKRNGGGWLCRCACGKERTLNAGYLRSGDTMSCGCQKRKIARGEAARLVREGNSMEDVASRYGVTADTLRASLNRFGFKKPRPEGIIQAVKREHIIYAAGLFDGEGSINIGRRSRGSNPAVGCQFQLRICIANTDIRVMQWLRKAFGVGSVFRKRKSNRHKPLYHWNTGSFKALDFLKMTRPYLIIKDNQADIAIEFQSKMDHGARRNEKDWAENSRLKLALESCPERCGRKRRSTETHDKASLLARS